MANEGLGWDPLLKMVHNPGGDWYPGQGDNPRYWHRSIWLVHFFVAPKSFEQIHVFSTSTKSPRRI